MIKILFPPGCYGTFLTKCLYNFTELNDTGLITFDFDKYGSSHNHRNNLLSKNFLQCGHIDSTVFDTLVDQVITVIPESNHSLDYYDNQFYKQEKQQIVSYINSMFEMSEINQKLINNWNYKKLFDDTLPRWILREWTSFWLEDCLRDSYNQTKYQQTPSLCNVGVGEIFDNLYTVIDKITTVLKLKITATCNQINLIQHEFVSRQQFHNIQARCQDWVSSVLAEKSNMASPCVTIFDEAYVQSLLRINGYEIQCNELNLFPADTNELKKIIYKI